MSDHETKPALACDIHQIPPEIREAFQREGLRLLASVLELRELPDGYALRVPDGPEVIQALGRFVAYDRLCCPFVRHGIESEPDGGPIWLSFRGGPGVKEAVAAELRHTLPEPLGAAL